MNELQRLKALSEALTDKINAENRAYSIAHAKYEATVSALADARQLIDIQARDVEKREQAGMVKAVLDQ